MTATITSRYDLITELPFSPVNSPVEVDGQFYPSSTYDFVKASSQRVDSTILPIANGSDNLSFGVWVYLNSLGVGHGVFTQVPAAVGNGDRWWFCDILSDGRIRLQMFRFLPSQAFIRSISSPMTLPLQTWFFLSGSLDAEGAFAGNVDIYINGAELSYQTQDQISGAYGPFTNMGNLKIGGGGFVIPYSDARFDNPIFGDDVVWTAQDHADLYAAELARIGIGYGPTKEQKERGLYLFDGPALSNA